MASFQAPPMGWPRAQVIPTTPIVKRVVRLDVPVDKYPNVSQGLAFALQPMLISFIKWVSESKFGSTILLAEYWDLVGTH